MPQTPCAAAGQRNKCWCAALQTTARVGFSQLPAHICWPVWRQTLETDLMWRQMLQE